MQIGIPKKENTDSRRKGAMAGTCGLKIPHVPCTRYKYEEGCATLSISHFPLCDPSLSVFYEVLSLQVYSRPIGLPVIFLELSNRPPVAIAIPWKRHFSTP